ncbi:hypothetical protein IFO70_32840 [Phormidium tenue FACHB-886]|nr:hypothetical protein [Phormidium tenue FACHB-886]
MARRSRWQHLKPDIERAFSEGKSPKEASLMFPQVPRQTISDWHSPFRQDSGNQSTEGEIEAEQGDRVVDLSTLPPGAEREIYWLKRQLRQHITQPTAATVPAVQACNAYLRAIELEQRLEAVFASGEAEEAIDEAGLRREAEIFLQARAATL